MCARDLGGHAFRNSITRGGKGTRWAEGAVELLWAALETSADKAGSSGASVVWGVILSQGRGPEVCSPGTQRFLKRCLSISYGPVLPATGEMSVFFLDVWMAHDNISPVCSFIKAVRLSSVPCCKGGTRDLWKTYEAIISHLVTELWGHRDSS